MAESQNPKDTTTGDHRPPPPTIPIGGLSPTVEKMFGALADGSDETKEDYFSELEAKRASQPGAP